MSDRNNPVRRWRGLLFTLATGPLDEFDDSANGDPDSMNGEDGEEGFDDMPVEAGWEEDDDDGGDEEDEEE